MGRLPLEVVLYQYPDLTEYGFGTYIHQFDTKLTIAKNFLKDRRALENNKSDFIKACDFMQKFEKKKTISISRYAGSYHLKHEFERDEGGFTHMPEGVIIAAGIAVGFNIMKRGTGVQFNLSAKSYRKVIKNPRI